MSRSDRVIGILLGLVVGVAVVILFVFGGGSGSIDAPALESSGQPEPAAPLSSGQGRGT